MALLFTVKAWGEVELTVIAQFVRVSCALLLTDSAAFPAGLKTVIQSTAEEINPAIALARIVDVDGPRNWMRPVLRVRWMPMAIAEVPPERFETPDTVVGKLTVTVSDASAPNPLRRA